jgi:hypothetical protein
MSVVPSLIVLAITALLVFRRELTQPMARTERRHANRAKPAPRPAARRPTRLAEPCRRVALEKAGQGLSGPR